MKNKLTTFVPLGVILLLVITNPSVKDFKDHLGKTSYKGLLRQHNLFIWSVYIDESEGMNPINSDHYIGFFGNFFILKHENPYYNHSNVDSARMDDIKVEDTNKWHPSPKDFVVPYSATLWAPKEGLPVPIKKLTIHEFANNVKSKFIGFKGMPDTSIVKMIIDAYPIYKKMVDTTGLPK